MAFKSVKQKLKFQQLVKEGKMKQETFDSFAKDTPDNLPNKITGPVKTLADLKVRAAKKIKVK